MMAQNQADLSRFRTRLEDMRTSLRSEIASRDEETPAELAIAVVLQNQTSTGGTTAAPIAQDVMEAILSQRENP